MMNPTDQVIRTEQNISWLPQPNESRHVLSSVLPPREAITTAFIFAFEGEQLVMSHLVRRGWDIPGGHIEPGETPEEAARREIYEETGTRVGALRFFGYQHLHVSGPMPDGYGYPYPDSYQVFYLARVTALDAFSSTFESYGRGLFAPNEARQLSWIRKNLDFYEAALQAI
ncbi:NUDIX domain-containing protein [Dictyobacter aurantiacus]|nr:NUDIX domain-containing protein [Dictyobacter aurantiacus]